MKHVDTNSIKHMAVCAILVALGGLLGLGMAIGASVTKEWCDRNSYGHWCWMDILFDAIGTMVGAAIHVGILIAIF